MSAAPALSAAAMRRLRTGSALPYDSNFRLK
jgi:hypothetical protein